MMAPQAEEAAASEARGKSKEPADLLPEIFHNSVESLELLRSLVQLLLPKAEPHDGPKLEELLAALVAMQRDQMALLRQIRADVGAIHDRLPAARGEEEGGSQISPRPNGRHDA